MKTLINIALIILVALSMLLLNGCHKFLDIQPKGKDIVRSIDHFDGLLNVTSMVRFIYNERREGAGTGTITTLGHWIFMTDELIANPTSMRNMTPAERNAFQWQADMFEPGDQPLEYGGLYQQIYTFNVIINGVMDAIDGTFEERRRIQAEARVARAYNYMMLAQFFGKPYNAATAANDLCVPLVLNASTAPITYSRASVKEIYDFILKELEEAVPYLGEFTRHRQRIFRPAGYAILGRAYMLVYDYEKAKNAFAQAEQFLAMSSIEVKLFDYKAEMPDWKASSGWEMGVGHPQTFQPFNTEVIFNRQLTMPFSGGVTSGEVITALIKPEYMNLFIDGDLRREFFTNRNADNYHKPFRSTHNEGVDLPNVYLMYAECLARTGDTEKARELVTHLRQHRFAEGFDYSIPAEVASQDDLIRFVVEERLREYMATGHRWFDMRRLWHDPLFQHLREDYTHTDGVTTWRLTEDRLVYRIPPSVLVHNPGWTNNP